MAHLPKSGPPLRSIFHHATDRANDPDAYDLGDLVDSDSDDDQHAANRRHSAAESIDPSLAQMLSEYGTPAAALASSSRGRRLDRNAPNPRSNAEENPNSNIRPRMRDHRYSIAARAKATSSKNPEGRLKETQKFYSINQIVTPKPNASSGDLIREHLKKDKVIRMPAPVEVVRKISFKELFRFADKNDKRMIAGSLLCAICGGALIPVMPVRILISIPTALSYVC